MTIGHPGRRRKLSYENRVTLMTLAGGLPAVLISLIILWSGDYTAKVQWTLTLVIAGCWLAFAMSVRERVVRPLQTMSNLLAALREGDFSVRGRRSKKGDALDGVLIEVNDLVETLHEQRLGALEATTLLRTVMAEIEVAVFAFDDERRLALVNRAGERLMAEPSERLLGRSAGELGLSPCFEGDPSGPLALHFPGGSGRWGVRVSSFREHGKPHQLLVLADLTRPLRAEEVMAWKRLVRVLGHELNNSLTPIKSIAGSLKTLIGRKPPPEDWQQDATDGLAIISSRAESLSRFMSAYARLAKLPEPVLTTVDVDEWVRRVVGLETRLEVVLEPGPQVAIPGDGDQLDQLLINLVRNGVDAAIETSGGVRAGWRLVNSHVEIWVADEGPGLSNTANLFVPFFTTKPGGSGIGLALCRQIAEAHNGEITLGNRSDTRGCEARLRLPV